MFRICSLCLASYSFLMKPPVIFNPKYAKINPWLFKTIGTISFPQYFLVLGEPMLVGL